MNESTIITKSYAANESIYLMFQERKKNLER